MLQVVEQTREEKIKMYMEQPIEKLAEMLVSCNENLDALIKKEPYSNDNAVVTAPDPQFLSASTESSFSFEKDTQMFICDCCSYTHQAIFLWDDEYKQLYVTIHLTTWKNIFKRFWKAMKYVFGYTSNYGEWDEFLFKKEDEEKLRNWLETEKR